MLNNGVVEILENLFLDHQPYLIRFTTWGQNMEIRASKTELLGLSKYFADMANNTQEYSEKDTVY